MSLVSDHPFVLVSQSARSSASYRTVTSTSGCSSIIARGEKDHSGGGVLGQGGLERAGRNNDQPRVQHDVAAKHLALDRSNNAARSHHSSADC
mmetsp:Transcript_26295/g.47488  ORF Transcript_26295/g.47488 Transcript_26295/m.47488 type:complete len:93 (-) Transcript_26295:7-285(-)